MGFWVMLVSFIFGLSLLMFGFSSRRSSNVTKNSLSKFSFFTGILFLGLAVYLAWPK